MVIDYEQLEERLDVYMKTFRGAAPFPHLVGDGFFEPEVARTVIERFPAFETMTNRYKSAHEHKAALADLSSCDAAVRTTFDGLNGPRFLRWLGAVTGIEHLLKDPHNLGGGIHQSGDGMYLDVHADFNRHTKLGWFRRLNLLVFLNPGWTDENGGILQLWREDMSQSEASIVPVFNRMAMFETTPSSYHGYDTIHLPPGHYRRSFATYSYTEAPPTEYEGRDHSTLFRLRPGQRRRFVPMGRIRAIWPMTKRAMEIARNRGRH